MTKNKLKTKKDEDEEQPILKEETHPENLKIASEPVNIDAAEPNVAIPSHQESDIPAKVDSSQPFDDRISMEEFENLKKELDKNTKLAGDYLSRLQYLQAEFDNYKKWSEKDKAEFTRIANEKLIRSILPVIDSIEKALESSKTEKSAFRDGIELIHNELMNILKNVGLSPMNAKGKKFDPFKHEAMMIQTIENAEDGTVLEELQKGYMLNDRVIRPAQVKIAKKSEKDIANTSQISKESPQSPELKNNSNKNEE